jgi:tight adherence protein B
MTLETLLFPLVFLGVLFTVILLWMALGSGRGGGSRRTRERVAATRARALGQTRGVASKETATATNVRREVKEGMPGLERIVRDHLPRVSSLRARLARTGTDMTPGTYVLINLVVAVLAGALIAVFSAMPLGFVLLGGLALGLALPHWFIGSLAKRRAERFITLFPDAIDLMVRGLKSGLPITEAIASVGRELAEPVGPEFRRVADSIKMGQTMEEALWETADRLDIQEFKFFVISLSVQRETGGNLGETLGNLSEVLRARKVMKLKIKALSSEARASAYILGSLPFVMFGILLLLNADYVMILFRDPRGWAAVGVGLTSIGIGIAVMYKMVKFEI